MYIGVSADDGSSECSSDSDMNIRPSKRQKNLVIGSDTGSGSETHSARECSLASAEE